ncbi:hypothetical protein [Streptomyces sp. NPDC048191]
MVGVADLPLQYRLTIVRIEDPVGEGEAPLERPGASRGNSTL